MEIIKTLLSKTCFFVIQTSFENDFIVQESSCRTSGHLMRGTPPDVTNVSD